MARDRVNVTNHGLGRTRLIWGAMEKSHKDRPFIILFRKLNAHGKEKLAAFCMDSLLLRRGIASFNYHIKSVNYALIISVFNAKNKRPFTPRHRRSLATIFTFRG